MTTALRFRFAGGHAPPARAPRARAQFLARFSSVRASIKGGDLNVAQRVAARMLGGRVVGEGVVWLRASSAWKVVDYELVDLKGDHLAIYATLRRRRGKHKGTLVRVLVVNAMSVSTGPEHAAHILRLGLNLGPDLVIGVECSDFRASEVGPHLGWHQPGRLDSAESGTALGVDVGFGRLDRRRERVGSPATDEGKHHPSANGNGIRERTILIGRVTHPPKEKQ